MVICVSGDWLQTTHRLGHLRAFPPLDSHIEISIFSSIVRQREQKQKKQVVTEAREEELASTIQAL